MEGVAGLTLAPVASFILVELILDNERMILACGRVPAVAVQDIQRPDDWILSGRNVRAEPSSGQNPQAERSPRTCVVDAGKRKRISRSLQPTGEERRLALPKKEVRLLHGCI